MLPRCKFTSVVPASTEYQLAVQALTDEIRQRRDVVLHRSHWHQRCSVERRGDSTDAVYTRSKAFSPASTSQGDTGCTVARTDSLNSTSRHGEQIQLREQQQQQQQCSIAYELTGGVCEVARHPLHRESVEEGVRAEHTKLTVKQPPPYTSDSNHLHNHANRARKSWRSDVLIILPGWRRHTGGSRSIPTVHPCGLRSGGCG